jgi:hypothetical protein
MSLNSAEAVAETSAYAAEQQRFFWDRAMFRSAETSDGLCPDTFDVTGARRILFSGPWARLAPGLWRATIIFDLCEEAARRQLAVEFGTAVSTFTMVDVPEGVSGRHEIEILHFVHGDEPLEVRFWVKRAAFHGSLSYIGAQLERVGDQPLPTADIAEASAST